MEPSSISFCFRKFLKYAGPGLLMSAAFMDPGNLEGDLQMGAQTGFQLLWVVGLSSILGFLVQYLAAKLGTVTGMDLAQICRTEFSRFASITIWIFMELGIICAYMQEVIGSAIAIDVLSSGSIPIWMGTLISILTAFAVLFLDDLGHRMLKGFFGVLVSVLGLSLLYIFWKANVPLGEAAKGLFIPRIHADQINVTIGMIGSVIMSYNIFLQSGLVVSRNIDKNSTVAKKEAVLYFGIEAALILLSFPAILTNEVVEVAMTIIKIAFLVNASVVCVFATGFFGTSGASGIGLKDAANLLAERFGPQVRFIWAIGLISSGHAAVMAGGMAEKFFMLGFLGLKVSKWKRLLYSRSLAIVPTLVVATMFHNSLDIMNEILNIVQSIVLPFALLPLLAFTSSKWIMGEMKNSLVILVIAWISGAAVIVTNSSFAVSSIVKVCSKNSVPVCVASSGAAGAYCALVLYILVVLWNRMKQSQPTDHHALPLLENQ